MQRQFSIFRFPFLLVFLVQPVTAAATTKLFKLKPVRRVLFVFGRHVVTLFALGALQNNVISRHFLIPYSITSETVPAPTVLPPSRMAKRRPFSMAIGAIRVISI